VSTAPPAPTIAPGVPGIADLWLVDPGLPYDAELRQALAADAGLRSRRRLLGPSRIVTRLLVAAVRAVKLVLPRTRSHRLLDWLCLRFLRRFVAPGSVALLIRHFAVENDLLDFLAANVAPGTVDRPALRPTCIRELGGSAVLHHDRNLYRCLAQLGQAVGPGGLAAGPQWSPVLVDASMLAGLPAIDPDRGWPARRWAHLDLEYEHAVHSLALDDPLMAILTTVTGDARLAALRPATSALQVRTHRDVPAELFHHAVINETALARLRAWAGTSHPNPTPCPSAQRTGSRRRSGGAEITRSG